MSLWKKQWPLHICPSIRNILRSKAGSAFPGIHGSFLLQAHARRKLNTACGRPISYRRTAFVSTCSFWSRRTLILDSIPAVLVPPVAFVGLFITLWTYKCTMMVLFQDKIIYMPYIPPFSRSEKLDDYASQCDPVLWRSVEIKSLDGTKIALCLGNIPCPDVYSAGQKVRHVVVCYFQGNGSSLPPRLPMLSNVLKHVRTSQEGKQSPRTKYTIVALSYRGYWISSGRASQPGIELDASTTLRWIQTEYGTEDVEVVVWGQSIGAGVASTAVAAYGMRDRSHFSLHISGLILETPFSSIRSMLSTMYPQKWLPYGYLWPFLWNHWDSEQALKRIARQRTLPKVLVIVASKDEIVPSTEGDRLEKLCHGIGLSMQRRDIQGALHAEATAKRAGQIAVAEFLGDITQHRTSKINS